jgi:formylglycine-generating enzyme required for sulfatase activity
MLKWGEWAQGGIRNLKEDLGSGGDSLPVLRVNIMEADCFARWVGGKLPTGSQWDTAGGKGLGEKAPFRDPGIPLQPGDVAINLKDNGPISGGTALRDESRFGCRDMAGNGLEWTRDLDDGKSFPPDQLSATDLKHLLVYVRGARYYYPEPFRFENKAEPMDFVEADPALGFRVVVEP